MKRTACAAALLLAFAASCAPLARAQDEEQAAPADEPQAPDQAAPEAPAQSEPAAPQTDAPEAQPAPIRPGKAGAGAAGVTFGTADTKSRSGGAASPAGRGAGGGGGPLSPGGAAGSDGATKACPDGPSYDSTRAPKFDFTQTEIMNSPSDVASWPVTASITKLDIDADGFHVDFTKRDGPGRWTDVRTPGWGGDLEYTLWMVESIDGQWYASGPVEYWNGLDRSGGAPSRVYDNWFYARDRWGAMSCHQPRVGETVGFLVTHGDARNGGNGSKPSKERSNVVFVPYPSDQGGAYSFGGP